MWCLIVSIPDLCPFSYFSDLSYLRQTKHGSVRCTPEPETSNVCVISSGAGSVCNRSTESELIGNVGICLFTIFSDSNLSKENSGRIMSSVPDCPYVGRTSMVSSSFRSCW